MSLQLPSIYPITDTRVSGLSHAEQVARLIDGGATLIQLREKHRMPGEWIDDAHDAMRAARDAGVRMIVNDRVDVAMVIGADGVHLGQEDLPPDAARRLMGDDAIIGFSTHSLEQALEAVTLPVDYIAFGPIFPTSTKEDPDPVVGIEMLARIRNAIGEFPLVAIGGINADDLQQVFARGADSAAMISEIVGDPDAIATRYSEIASIRAG